MKASFPNHHVKWKECKIILGVTQHYHGKTSREKSKDTSANCETLYKTNSPCNYKIHFSKNITVLPVILFLKNLDTKKNISR